MHHCTTIPYQISRPCVCAHLCMRVTLTYSWYMLESHLHNDLVPAKVGTANEEAPHEHPVKSSAVVHNDKDRLVRRQGSKITIHFDPYATNQFWTQVREYWDQVKRITHC